MYSCSHINYIFIIFHQSTHRRIKMLLVISWTTNCLSNLLFLCKIISSHLKVPFYLFLKCISQNRNYYFPHFNMPSIIFNSTSSGPSHLWKKVTESKLQTVGKNFPLGPPFRPFNCKILFWRWKYKDDEACDSKCFALFFATRNKVWKYL